MSVTLSAILSQKVVLNGSCFLRVVNRKMSLMKNDTKVCRLKVTDLVTILYSYFHIFFFSLLLDILKCKFSEPCRECRRRRGTCVVRLRCLFFFVFCSSIKIFLRSFLCIPTSVFLSPSFIPSSLSSLLHTLTKVHITSVCTVSMLITNSFFN